MTKQIDISGLRLGYAKSDVNRLLRFDFNAHIKPGERIGIMGLNGCGKTTLLETLTGNLKALKGTIQLDGFDLQHLSFSERARFIARVFTRYNNPGSLSVFDVLSMGRYPHTNRFNQMRPDDHRILSNVLNSMGLQEIQDRLFNELSDGERQKVMLATALVQQALILVLDEPGSHLDLRNKSRLIYLLLQESLNHSTTLLFSSHDPDLVQKLATRVWVFKNEQIIDYDLNTFSSDKAWKWMESESASS